MKENSLGRVLVVDDDQGLVDLLCDFLSSEGYGATGSLSPAEALEALKKQEFDLLLTDLMMPDMDGIELLSAAKEIDPNLVGVIMTGQGTIRTSVEAMKAGAFDYLLKPFTTESLLPVVSRAMRVRQLQRENIELRGTMAVYELTKVINVSMDADVIANKVADAAMELCNADEVSIMLPTAEGDKLYVAAIRGKGRERLLGKQTGIGDGVAGWVAHHLKTLVLDGEINDPRFEPIAPRPEISFAVSLAMVAGGNFVGVVNINKLNHRSFTEGQIKALNVMVGIAAPSLQNSALFRRMQTIEEKYRGIVEHALEGIFQMTPDGRILTANPSLAAILGYGSPQELLGSRENVAKGIFADEKQYRTLLGEIERLGEVRSFEARILRRDRKEVWVQINARAVRDSNGNDLYYEGTLVDVGRQKEMENVLIRASQQWRVTFDSIHDMVWLCDPDGTVLRCNKATQEYLDRPYSEIINQPCFLMVHGDSAPIKDCPLAKARVTKTRESQIHQIGEHWYTITVSPILDDQGNLEGAVHVISDITQNKRTEEELRAMSLRDELTGLLNRRGFLTLAEQQLRLVHRMKKRLILLFIDLDRMKWINDTLGHPEGDLALKNAGIILKKTFRESDLVSRVGGDEFVVVTVNAFDENMENILARLERNVAAFNAASQAPYPLSLSIGAVSSDEEESCAIEALLTKADQRMYEHKKTKNLNMA
ncbi:MAG: diguanylate cyclase [Deltaproteobacteria bacterium]|nr:diguanylate cyclase [Deltaproteobacteria bacterium]